MEKESKPNYQTRPFLSFKQTQELLDCSRSFIYGLINSDKLKPKYIGRKPYFMMHDLVSLTDKEQPGISE